MCRAPIFIGGPSGVGKSYIVRSLVERFDCEKIVTLTTRPLRKGEVNGQHYEFVSQERFLQLETAGELAVKDRLLAAAYGLKKGEVERIQRTGRTPLCEVYAPHIDLFRAAFPACRSIYLMPISVLLLEERMKQRGDTEEPLQNRMRDAKREIEQYETSLKHLFDRIYIVTGQNTEDILNDIAQTFLGQV